jgi:hypothetical protein
MYEAHGKSECLQFSMKSEHKWPFGRPKPRRRGLYEDDLKEF